MSRTWCGVDSLFSNVFEIAGSISVTEQKNRSYFKNLERNEHQTDRASRFRADLSTLEATRSPGAGTTEC